MKPSFSTALLEQDDKRRDAVRIRPSLREEATPPPSLHPTATRNSGDSESVFRLAKGKQQTQSTNYKKILADHKTKAVLGVSMLGANAGEVIHEAAMALRFRAKVVTLLISCMFIRPWQRP
jgi:hypothetical protein